MDAVLTSAGATAAVPVRLRDLVRRVLEFDPASTRVVILGGGTGLSTVVGGNSQMPDWPENPSVGLKEEFPALDVVVCTTDDGGSTGRLLESLPMIGIGDLRKSCLSLIRPDRFRRTYGGSDEEARRAILGIQGIFNCRFTERVSRARLAAGSRDGAASVPAPALPPVLADSLRSIGAYLAGPDSPLAVDPRGHCLGNLILTGAVFEAAGGRTGRAPGLTAITAGLDRVARLIGSPPHRLASRDVDAR